MKKEHIEKLRTSVEELYAKQNPEKISFHTFPHVQFVAAKAKEFGRRNTSNTTILTAAALLHDVNYIVDPKSEVRAGHKMRADLLDAIGVGRNTVNLINHIISSADISTRGTRLVPEAQALSDADMLFKVLPVTPILFAHRYMNECGFTITKLARKIITDQEEKLKTGTLFFDSIANEKYTSWARANITLWRQVLDCEADTDVLRLLQHEVLYRER